VANRLPPDLRARLDLVAMLGLGYHAGFHVGLLDFLHTTSSPRDPPVAPELAAMHAAGLPMLCVFGEDEKESLCRDASDTLLDRVGRSGGHHFDGDRRALADLIADRLSALRRAAGAPGGQSGNGNRTSTSVLGTSFPISANHMSTGALASGGSSAAGCRSR
jgi:type IV secretory pathway VirJ component